MAIMTEARAQSEFTDELLKKGTYRVKLAEIRSKKQYNRWKEQEEERLMWMFDTIEQRKSNDYPFRFFKRTGLSYGPEKADLTKLINEIYGRPFTTEEYGSFDVQKLEGHEFEVMIGKETWQDGSEHNCILAIEAVDLEELPWPDGVDKAKALGNVQPKLPEVPAEAPTADDDPLRLSDKERATLIKRLKLTPEEAEQMDPYGNMPGDEGYDPFVNE